MNFKDLKQLCLSHGFTNVVPLACDTIELKPEVRQMCASDSQFILSYSLFAFLHGSAVGRTTPTFVVFVTGIGGAHLTYFWL